MEKCPHSKEISAKIKSIGNTDDVYLKLYEIMEVAKKKLDALYSDCVKRASETTDPEELAKIKKENDQCVNICYFATKEMDEIYENIKKKVSISEFCDGCPNIVCRMKLDKELCDKFLELKEKDTTGQISSFMIKYRNVSGCW